MNILKVNFADRLRHVLRSIEEADFIAIDTEFTGFSSSLATQYSYFDSLEERYLKVRQNVNEFWVCQLGICPFKYSETQEECFASPFNIYLLPHSRSRTFSIDPNNMRFLAYHNFDFTELFTQGVSCSRLTEIDRNLQPQPSEWPTRLLSKHTQALLEDYEAKLQVFCESEETSVKLAIPSAYIKGLLCGRDGVLTRCKNLDIVWTEAEGTLEVALAKQPGKQVCLLPLPAACEMQTEEERYLETAGATIIFSALVKCRKPMIGHNFYLDLALLYNHFVSELPLTLAAYKTAVSELFPQIYDTRGFAETLKRNQEVERTDLGGLFAALRKRTEESMNLKICINEGFADYFSEITAHDAGCDAFMTGYIYAVCMDLLVRAGLHASAAEIEQTYLNRICLVNHSKRVSNFADLNETDTVFANVLVLQTPPGVSLQQVGELVRQYGDISVLQTQQDEFCVEFHFLCNGQSLSQVAQLLQAEGVKAEPLRPVSG